MDVDLWNITVPDQGSELNQLGLRWLKQGSAAQILNWGNHC